MKYLRVVIFVFSSIFLFLGSAWLLKPSFAADELGMELLTGIGKNSQIADLSAFFLTAGVMMLLGGILNKKEFFYAPVLMIALAAFGRIVASIVHQAALPIEMVVFEVFVSSTLIFYSSKLSE